MKKFVSILLVVLLVLSLAGCKGNENNVIILDDLPSDSSSNNNKDTSVSPPEDNNVSDSGGDDDLPPADNSDIPADESDDTEDEPSHSVTLYFSDDAGTNFISYPVTLTNLVATNIVGALADMGILDSGVTVFAFTHTVNGDETVISLDLNSAFAQQLASCPQGYGYMLIGSVVNTFLDAYDANSVVLTAGGKAITADGVTFSGPLSFFGANPNPPAGEEPAPEDGEILTDDNPVVNTALSLVGAPYEYGGSGPDSFDNSGFVHYCFKVNGIDIPRRTSAMFLEGDAVNKNDLRKGDAVFFSFDGSTTNPTYVAIYLGDGKAIAESNEDNPVSVFSITTSYYSNSYVGARRYS